MATKALRGSRATIYVDGLNASAFLNEYEIEAEREDLEFSPFESDDKEFLAGPSENTITLTGAWNGDADSLDARLDATFGGDADNIITICPGGVAATGKGVYLVPGTNVTYTVSAASDEIAEAEAEFRSARLRGVILQGPTTVSATGNGSPAPPATAATTKGATAHLHVLAVTGTPTSVAISVEHSADGTTWVPLVSFPTVTEGGVGYQVSTVNTATVNVQMRAKHTITGGTTPTVTYVLAAGRNR
jgi:hypothetical protein